MKIISIIRSNKIIFVIVILAAILRLYKLGSVPPHLTSDEAALGYNAYSILETGKDEYGEILPLVFKSFGDYKPGLYVYAAVPFVAILGLNEFSTRLPSALVGVLSILMLYLILKSSTLDKSKTIALCVSFMLAVSPWHILFSRGAWEVNLAAFLSLLGIYFFTKSRNHIKYLYLSAISFALTLIAYQGAKLSTGIVLLVIGLIYYKRFIKLPRKHLLLSGLIFFLISIPIIASFFTGQTGRLNIYNIFNYPRPAQYLQNILDQGGETKGSLIYYLFHSESYNFFTGIVGRYLKHFSPQYLFFGEDIMNPRQSLPNHGMLLLVELILIPLGVSRLIKIKFSKTSMLFVAWLLLASLPSILTRDQVNSVRAYNMLFGFAFISGMGLTQIILQKKYLLMTRAFIVIAIVISLIHMLDALFVHVPTHNAKAWDWGYKQIVETVTPIQNNYRIVRIQQSYSQPYIFFLFFQKYDPARYQAQAQLTESPYGDVGYIEHLDNLCFCPIDWSVNKSNTDTLFVADEIQMPVEESSDPSQFRLIKQIDYPKSVYNAFRIVDVVK